MQVVIDLPEDVYTRLFDNGIQDNEIAVDDVCEMARAIRLGTQLPKGHGKIGDLDALQKEVSSWGMNDYEPSDFIDAIDWADTIIEADRAESEANGKVCCNCRHNIRHWDDGRCVCVCEIDTDRRMGYVQVMTGWCRHWAKDKEESEGTE